MSHQANDILHDQMSDLFWDIYDTYIAEGYDASIAETKAIEAVDAHMEKWGT